jgi:hypothetical protein
MVEKNRLFVNSWYKIDPICIRKHKNENKLGVNKALNDKGTIYLKLKEAHTFQFQAELSYHIICARLFYRLVTTSYH